MKLANTRALVTGASRGLGKSIAEVLAARGVEVAVVARDAESLNLLAKQLKGKAYPTDLGEPDAVEGLIDRVEADGPVDIVINNAGIDHVGRFHQVRPEQIRSLLQVNLAAPMEICRQLIPRMVQRGRGHIVNVSSMGAISQGPGLTLYGTSKAGLSHFTAGIRGELRGKPVGTTLVQIGEVKTDMIDHIRAFGPARRTIERSIRWRMIPRESLDPVDVSVAIAEAIEHNRRHVILPRNIVPMAKFTEFPRRISELMLTGIDQDND
ncbi:short-chain dehydrogenase [Mycolicibacterium conceptionense]|uniref:Short-chain dehydrogenase n=1 Tax=Mycolicibacterium conceptionense TaxID=451644 RepID=A0A1A0PHP2_9MYCO|nr:MULTISPECIES: SDR family NAD(P)-dependent oxidoreductase [Mycolicibacterium]MCW1822214.1 SDR family NAD(P)-dependent oxidoreductase [Mycolicibacterium senegalense]OBB09232.1 short-chain dehydrogenase [Mycolicibacterium conceptionense]OBF06018.1 short-chain dehydrogenase [Mycolicibacterium conceptionense]OBF27301.1 short-chain dehydrogenase [Mycolicibacterium conceptionense]OBF46683.1 short-chain dehydrogenase [Mycolicibacterium conceptionense]